MRADDGNRHGICHILQRPLAPHLELSQHPVHNGKTYDEYVVIPLADIGPRRWNKRMRKAIDLIAILVSYDILYIGGGNARHIKPPLPKNVALVSNDAGITGGVRLWDSTMDAAFIDSESQQPGVRV
jgi:polyphosphate glucokinase